MNMKFFKVRAYLLLGFLLAACVDKAIPTTSSPTPTILIKSEAVAAIPRVCAEIFPTPIPFGTLEPLAIKFIQSGYAAEWFVAPGLFNMPQEVMVTPLGDLLVHSVRSGIINQVAENGKVKLFSKDIRGYLGSVDAQGNLYMYWTPGGLITRISPNGLATVIVNSPDLQAACDSGFGIGPDGNLYVALNHCSNTADLMQITPAGKVTRKARSIPWMSAMRSTLDGRFLGAGYDIYEISLNDFSFSVLAPTPERNLSPGGMAFDDDGNIYISNGSRASSGRVYRITPHGDTTLLAEIPLNGLSGIEWLPRTKEIIGGQLRQGGLIAVSMDGKLREIIPGNGLVSPMGMAFSPCGDLAVANDDGGMMALVNPAGKVSWFFDYPSFTPPTPFVCFKSDGTLFASVGAPGMPEEILTLIPGGVPRTLVKSSMPCGLAYQANNTLLVAETSTGRIMQIKANGSKEIFVEGLKFPQDLELDSDGNVYVITGPSDFEGDAVFKTPNNGDIILRITPNGSISTLARLQGVAALAISPEGDLYAAAGSRVMRVEANGSVTILADGLRSIRGLTFDLAGNLYVADADLNGILRIGGFPHGILSGQVTDGSNKPIAGARVQVISDHPIVVGQLVTTNADGRFQLLVAPRIYSIIVSAENYKTTKIEAVRVVADQDKTLEIELAR